jgi:uncharacterized damage-inducible protein DinB
MIYPELESVPAFYRGYVNHVKDYDMYDILKKSNKQALEVVRSIPEEKGEYRYAAGKWSIKELLCHMLDVERVFAYRALRFARNDKTPLPGFEENDYAPEANAHNRAIKNIADQMERLRQTTLDLFEAFTPEMLIRKGVASNAELSVVNIGFIIPGHETHHRKVLQERYLGN